MRVVVNIGRSSLPATVLAFSEAFTYVRMKAVCVEQVTARIGKALSVDPLCIRLTMHNPYSDLPKPTPLKYRGVENLHDMLLSFQKTSDILFYEVLRLSFSSVVCLASVS